MGEPLIDHFESPRNVGEVPSPDAVGTAENPVCGDEVRVSARVREGTVREIRYRAFGCHATIAAMSLLSERVRGGSVEEAASVEPEVLIAQKHLFTTHYFEARIEFSSLFANGSDRTYLVYVDRSLFDDRVAGVKRKMLVRGVLEDVAKRMNAVRDHMAAGR